MANTNERDSEIIFQVIEHIGPLKAFPNGWSKEVNIVKWNDADPKFDIRDWDMEHKHMTKGITLREDEMTKLVELLTSRGTELHIAEGETGF